MKYFLTKFKGALISALVFVVLLGFIYFRDSDNKEVVNAEGSYDDLYDE